MTDQQLDYYNRKATEIMCFKYFPESEEYFAHWTCKIKNENRLIYEINCNFEFNSSFDWQIPLWQKIWENWIGLFHKQTMEQDAEGKMFAIREKYYKSMDSKTPDACFEYICQAIDYLEKYRNHE